MKIGECFNPSAGGARCSNVCHCCGSVFHDVTPKPRYAESVGQFQPRVCFATLGIEVTFV
jgi:hypothetical protein